LLHFGFISLYYTIVIPENKDAGLKFSVFLHLFAGESPAGHRDSTFLAAQQDGKNTEMLNFTK